MHISHHELPLQCICKSGSLVAICPPIATSSSSVVHFSFMSVGNHLPNNMLSYLLDGEGQNDFTSHMEKTRTLKLKNFKKM